LILSANATSFRPMFLAFSLIQTLGYSSPSFLLFLSATWAVLFSVILANALWIVICNMSLAISVMEGRGGYSAILKACFLLRGKTSMALFLALLVNVALAAIPVILKRYLPIYSCWQKSNIFEGIKSFDCATSSLVMCKDNKLEKFIYCMILYKCL
jgi:hypothetical protein